MDNVAMHAARREKTGESLALPYFRRPERGRLVKLAPHQRAPEKKAAKASAGKARTTWWAEGGCAGCADESDARWCGASLTKRPLSGLRK